MTRSTVPDHGIAASEMLAGDAALADRAVFILEKLRLDAIASRIEARDPTVWRDDPYEIANRLGWLDLSAVMAPRIEEIRGFVDRLRADAVKDVVLLGMGGSSLAPEVFRRTFGSAAGHPRLHVLDTTSPDWIRRVTREVDPRRLHGILASKSGSTIEVRTLFAHFLELVRAAGVDRPGSRFSAITDPGTGLESLARAQEFATIFTNPPDVGGRYSALSYFGLVPACVLGVDAALLLARSAEMAQRCRASVPVTENPGLVLGALLGAAALSGRDKLTLETSPRIESFGLWVEQLIAESTGKDGTGIVPIVGEPRLEPRRSGEDRLFVACVLPGDDDLLQRAASLAAAGQPVVTLRLRDPHDLGGEMFRWEYATAVAGHLLGIHPFDQPNVESAKKRARSILETLARGEAPPAIPEEDPLPALARARSGSTIAFMVFGDPRPELESALHELRAALVETRGVATTVGFGPRFLHSTGQLHKGGPRDALFVQLLIEEAPLPIPGEAFGFEALLAAQAAGDWLALRDAGRSVIRAPRTKSPVDAIRTWTTRLRSLRR